MRIPEARLTTVLVTFGLAVLMAACGRSVDDPRDEQTQVVRGIARYAEPLQLSTQARMISQLKDASVENGEVITEKELAPPGQVPIPFEMQYAPAQVGRDTPLTVTVEIHDQGALLFVTEQPIPVRGRGTADILEVMLTPTEAAQELIDALPEDEPERDEPPDFEPPDFDPDFVPDPEGVDAPEAPPPAD